MMNQYGALKKMNYNTIVIISVIISAIISYLVSFYGTSLLLEQNSGLFKFTQLIIAIVTLTTIYSPLKVMLLKYVDLDEFEDKKND